MAEKFNSRNIIVGAADLYYANNAGQTPVTPPDAVAGTRFLDTLDGSDFVSLGGTQEGVEVAYEPDYGEVQIDQSKSPVLMFNQGLTINLNTNLAEATLENLLVAWGAQDDDLADGTFTIGDPADVPFERTVVLVGNAPRTADGAARERIYTAWRCISVEGSTHALRRTDPTIFPVSFRLLPATPQDLVEAGVYADLAAAPQRVQYGRIQDREIGTA
jgi:hypothetical protein